MEIEIRLVTAKMERKAELRKGNLRKIRSCIPTCVEIKKFAQSQYAEKILHFLYFAK